MTTLSSDTPRCSTDEQDLTVQREGLAALGVTADRDLRRSRADRLQPRPTGLREALAACREGDSLFVTNSIDWPGPPRTPGRSRTSSRLGGSGSAWAAP
jgi:hypothetical protein